MKILTIGLDNSVLNKNSGTAKRTVEYGNLVDKYVVVVPAKEDIVVELSPKVSVYGVGGRSKALIFFKIFFKANSIIKKEKINIISVQDAYYLALLVYILSKKFNIGSEVQVRGFENNAGLRKCIAKHLIRRFKSVKTISNRLTCLMIGDYAVDRNRITQIPIFTDISRGLKYQREYDVKDVCRLLTVSRLVPVKNIVLQIRALKNIIDNNENIRMELLIVGDGPEKKSLQGLVKRLNLNNLVKFVGWQNEVERFYKEADIFLLTSNSEGWGKVVIEAASYGLPIVMTDVGCAKEVIRNNETGIVITVNNQEELETVIINLYKNKDLRERFGVKVRQVILNLPSIQETKKKYIKSWKNALT